ncbi:tripartite tricarboxylate transporter TctB family protein [Mesorhizobium sp. ASY16-5R]|uniref:tripartite tricarboxylate transporter TctB family protein n=1 Tax=Mesorhizobium sp. ASY16-5R TaxID=3445772 RepID=UPI003FA0FF61
MSTLVARKHLIAGLLFALMGASVTIMSLRYKMGTLHNMGPGFLPFWLGLLLAGLGVVAAVQALLAAADERRPRIEPRQLLFVLGSVLCFALLLKPLGMILSVVVMTLVASFASSEFRMTERIAVAVGLAVLAYLIFDFALGLPIPLAPQALLHLVR